MVSPRSRLEHTTEPESPGLVRRLQVNRSVRGRQGDAATRCLPPPTAGQASSARQYQPDSDQQHAASALRQRDEHRRASHQCMRDRERKGNTRTPRHPPSINVAFTGGHASEFNYGAADTIRTAMHTLISVRPVLQAGNRRRSANVPEIPRCNLNRAAPPRSRRCRSSSSASSRRTHAWQPRGRNR